MSDSDFHFSSGVRRVDVKLKVLLSNDRPESDVWVWEWRGLVRCWMYN